MDKIWVKDVKEGDRPKSIFLVARKATPTAKSGKPYLSVTFQDKTGELERASSRRSRRRRRCSRRRTSSRSRGSSARSRGSPSSRSSRSPRWTRRSEEHTSELQSRE